jgi:hypothetical protein
MIYDNKIFVFDNIITLEEQDNIKNILLSDNFNWYYCADITNSEFVKENPRPGFKHSFLLNQKINSDYYNLILPIVNESCKKINFEINKILRSKAFLQLPLNLNNNYTLDSPHIDIDEKHLVVLYYVLDSDGDTVIFDNKFGQTKTEIKFEDLNVIKKITPKKGTVVIFDGHYFHSAYQPKSNLRCVINCNVI